MPGPQREARQERVVKALGVQVQVDFQTMVEGEGTGPASMGPIMDGFMFALNQHGAMPGGHQHAAGPASHAAATLAAAEMAANAARCVWT